MSFSEEAAQREDNRTVTAPRLRTNISASLTLSTTWQRLNFAGTSTLNVNTFTMPAGSPSPAVYWDSTNKLFKFQATGDRNYDFNFNIVASSSAVLSLLNVSLTNIQLRYVVPSPTPIYFPLPDSDQCINLMKAGLVSTDNASDNRVIYANSAIRQYGLGMEMRISSSFLGTATATLTSGDLIIFGR